MNEPQCSVSLPLSPSNDNEPRPPSPPAASSAPHGPTALPPSPSPVGSPLSDVYLFLGPPSPFADPESDPTYLSPTSLGDETYVQGDPDTTKACIAASTQTDPWSPTRRVRKQLFDPHLRTLKTIPPAPLPSPYDYGLRVDTRETRRHCDWASCVKHSLRLLRADVCEVLRSAPGIRFVHLAHGPVTLSFDDKFAETMSPRFSHPLRLACIIGRLLSCICHSKVPSAPLPRDNNWIPPWRSATTPPTSPAVVTDAVPTAICCARLSVYCVFLFCTA